MNLIFHPEAEVELLDAAEFYENQQSGLGRRLSKEVRATICRICEHPHAWEKLDAEYHRCLTNCFPYGIIYQIESQHPYHRDFAASALFRDPWSRLLRQRVSTAHLRQTCQLPNIG